MNIYPDSYLPYGPVNACWNFLFVGHPIHEASRPYLYNVRISEEPHSNPVITQLQFTSIRRSMHSMFINKHASLYQYIFRDNTAIHSTATRFGLFQTVIRPYVF